MLTCPNCEGIMHVTDERTDPDDATVSIDKYTCEDCGYLEER